MADPLHKTKGLVLKTIQYGETSVIVSVYTELFGLQSYIVNGIRVSSKNGNNKANFFQPGALLELVVYHNEQKSLQRIKEFKFAIVYKHIFSQVIKNGVAVFMVELLHKTLHQPEQNENLFGFMEDSLLALDAAGALVTANFPCFFAIHLCSILGFLPGTPPAKLVASSHLLFDLQSGEFTDALPGHLHFAERDITLLIAELMQTRLPEELSNLQLSSQTRNRILDLLELYYSLHLPDFGKLKTLPVLRAILN